jgi:hypothetical protein
MDPWLIPTTTTTTNPNRKWNSFDDVSSTNPFEEVTIQAVKKTSYIPTNTTNNIPASPLLSPRKKQPADVPIPLQIEQKSPTTTAATNRKQSTNSNTPPHSPAPTFHAKSMMGQQQHQQQQHSTKQSPLRTSITTSTTTTPPKTSSNYFPSSNTKNNHHHHEDDDDTSGDDDQHEKVRMDDDAAAYHSDANNNNDDDDIFSINNKNNTSSSNNPFDNLEAWIPSQDIARLSRRATSKEDNNDDDDDEMSSKQKPDADLTSSPPSIPARPVFAKELMAKYVMDPQAFAAAGGNGPLLAYVTSIVEQTTFFLMDYDPVPRVFKLIHPDSGRLLLVAHKRTDGLKALSFASNFSICIMPDNTKSSSQRGLDLSMTTSASSSSSELPPRIAKLRGNTLGSRYVLFDNGNNPDSSTSKTTDTRKELAVITFSNVPGIFSRRNTTVHVPKSEQFIRFASSSNRTSLDTRGKLNDPTVVNLLGTLPYSNRLPQLAHYGVYATKNSIKNFILHDPLKADDGIHAMLGKLGRCRFNLIVGASLSPLQAFACAIASFDSKVLPNYQI